MARVNLDAYWPAIGTSQSPEGPRSPPGHSASQCKQRASVQVIRGWGARTRGRLVGLAEVIKTRCAGADMTSAPFGLRLWSFHHGLCGRVRLTLRRFSPVNGRDPYLSSFGIRPKFDENCRARERYWLLRSTGAVFIQCRSTCQYMIAVPHSRGQNYCVIVRLIAFEAIEANQFIFSPTTGRNAKSLRYYRNGAYDHVF